MNKKRLLKLADFLETVPPLNFDITSWVTVPASKPEGKRPGECGFAGCAFGWAAHAKLFKGLTLGAGPLPQYEGHYGMIAAEKLFEIEHENTRRLFDYPAYLPNRYPTPKQVAKRIRKFVESGTIT